MCYVYDVSAPDVQLVVCFYEDIHHFVEATSGTISVYRFSPSVRLPLQASVMRGAPEKLISTPCRIRQFVMGGDDSLDLCVACELWKSDLFMGIFVSSCLL